MPMPLSATRMPFLLSMMTTTSVARPCMTELSINSSTAPVRFQLRARMLFSMCGFGIMRRMGGVIAVAPRRASARFETILYSFQCGPEVRGM